VLDAFFDGKSVMRFKGIFKRFKTLWVLNEGVVYLGQRSEFSAYLQGFPRTC